MKVAIKPDIHKLKCKIYGLDEKLFESQCKRIGRLCRENNPEVYGSDLCYVCMANMQKRRAL